MPASFLFASTLINNMKPQFCFATIFWLLSALNGACFSSLFVYGDSLSDTGRIPSSAPSYYNGRWSNGSVWVEYLSVRLGFSYSSANNLAFAGTTTSYLAAEVGATPASPNLPSGLCAIWSGGNDFRNNLNDGVYNDSSWSNLIAAAVSNITNSVGLLAAKGARNMLVCNLPDLGKVPELRQSYSSAYQAYISGKVVLFNTALASALNRLAQARPDLSLYQFDVYSKYASLLAAPASFGFTVEDIGALDDPSLGDKSFNGPGSSYVFWDAIHPTTKAHSLIADWAYHFLAGASSVRLGSSRSGSSFTLQMQNLSPGFTYTLQSSTNLSVWSDYQAVSATNATQTIVTTNSAPRKFFRIRF
jgi:phospholipase/lecithinase/hemolysin